MMDQLGPVIGGVVGTLALFALVVFGIIVVVIGIRRRQGKKSVDVADKNDPHYEEISKLVYLADAGKGQSTPVGEGTSKRESLYGTDPNLHSKKQPELIPDLESKEALA